jgi:hypothetical protein
MAADKSRGKAEHGPNSVPIQKNSSLLSVRSQDAVEADLSLLVTKSWKVAVCSGRWQYGEGCFLVRVRTVSYAGAETMEALDSRSSTCTF